MSNLDLQAQLRKKLAEIEQRSKGGERRQSFKFWKPKEGRNVIRILPPKGENSIYSEARVHFGVGPNKRMVVCPQTIGQPCPVCEQVNKLWQMGGEENERMARSLRATERYYYNVIDRTLQEGDEGYNEVMVFSSGVTIFQAIATMIVDPDFGDVTDPEAGFNLIINRQKGEGRSVSYTVSAQPKQTPLGLDNWEEKAVDLSIFTKPKSYEEIVDIMNGVEGNNNNNQQVVRETPTNDNGAKDIESEISALLNADNL